MSKSCFTMLYEDNYGFNFSVEIDEDANLTDCFARFVEMTRVIGYQPGSWDNILKHLDEQEINAHDYSLYNWASDTIYD